MVEEMRDVKTVLSNVLTDTLRQLSSEGAAQLSFVKLDSEFQLIDKPCSHNFTVLVLSHCVVSTTAGSSVQRQSSETPLNPPCFEQNSRSTQSASVWGPEVITGANKENIFISVCNICIGNNG